MLRGDARARRLVELGPLVAEEVRELVLDGLVARVRGGGASPEYGAEMHVASPVSYTHLTLPTNREV